MRLSALALARPQQLAQRPGGTNTNFDQPTIRMDESLIRPVNEYTIGWICALSLELEACLSVLDTIHSDCGHPGVKSKDIYVLGDIGKHNVVVATLPEGIYGNNRAAVVAARLTAYFSNVKFLFMVGIGGGIPNLSNNNDIRLGDVVVSIPEGRFPGVVKWDMGKAEAGDTFNRTGTCDKPPDQLLSLIPILRSRHRSGRGKTSTYIEEVYRRNPHLQNWKYLGEEKDNLYHATYEHEQPKSRDCSSCDPDGIVKNRPKRGNTNPVIHYGIIASGDQVIKDALKRDAIGKELNAKCIEMEGAGTIDAFPCLVVRGICDYCDSHKNKDWQPYAALAAAAYTKELIQMVPRSVVEVQPTAQTVQNTRGHSKTEDIAETPTPAVSAPNVQNRASASNGRNAAASNGSRYRISPMYSNAALDPRTGASAQTTARPDSSQVTIKPSPVLPLDSALKRYCVAAVSWSNWSYRLYFQDSNGICEASRDTDKWSIKKVPEVDAAQYTPIAAVSRKGGTDIRLYYLAPDLILREMRYTASRGWFAGTLDYSKIKVAPNSRIAAVAWSGYIRVYYQGYNYDRIEELRYADSPSNRGSGHIKGWERGASLRTAVNGSSIAAACYTSDRIRIHVFYQDENLNIQELVYDGAGYVGGALTPTQAPRYTPITACGLLINSGQVIACWKSKEGRMVEYSGSDSPDSSTRRELDKDSFAGIDMGPALAVVSLDVYRTMKRNLFVYRGGNELNMYEECWISDGRDWADSLKVA
ncbi:hypothetical protein TWF696_007401 [Orbilia brochopaga]|uniref:Nucleoside phosphorylase domain-containing protein n=1 Tax=Orbilia brochopaga TaxID=3140254 RepID=A0AAV9UV39_9PEZI